jgi:chromosome segregation ATPase
MKTTAQNQCLKCGAILVLPESLAAGTCADCRQKANLEPRQETRWQLEAQVKAAEQQLAQKNQQLLDIENAMIRLKSDRDELLAALRKVIDHVEIAHWDKQDGVFAITCDQARAALAKIEGGQS